MSVSEHGARGFTVTFSTDGPDQGRIVIEWSPDVAGNLEFQMANMNPARGAQAIVDQIQKGGRLSVISFSVLVGLLARMCLNHTLGRG